MSDGYTKGPWEACDPGDYSDYDGRCRVIIGDDLRIVVVLGDHDESAANARLIAAAPDLLAALDHVIHVIEKSENWWIDCPDRGGLDAELIRAAIARARGAGFAPRPDVVSPPHGGA